MKRVAIVQSSYLPWKGYFDLIASVDEFVLYDCVQYTRRDWRNRNNIKTKDGLRWLTVPVHVKGRYAQRIDETRLVDGMWVREHLAAVRHSYARAGSFASEFPWLESTLAAAPQSTISDVNRYLIEAICMRLGVGTTIRSSAEFELAEERNERLLQICRQAGATEYVSGPAAKAYLDEALFAGSGIAVRWKSYAGFSPYPQPHPPFVHAVSIIDTMLCTGQEARRYIASAPSFEA